MFGSGNQCLGPYPIILHVSGPNGTRWMVETSRTKKELQTDSKGFVKDFAAHLRSDNDMQGMMGDDDSCNQIGAMSSGMLFCSLHNSDP